MRGREMCIRDRRQALRQQFDQSLAKLERMRASAGRSFIRENGKRLMLAFTEAEEIWKRESIEFFQDAQKLSLIHI